MSLVKSKWLSISIDNPIADIVNIMTNYQYKDNIKAGFTDINYINNEIEATFVEKIILTEYIIDPYGNESEQYIDSFNYITFKFIGNKLLEIINPPRSIKNLINFLSKIFDFGFFTSQITLDIKKLTRNIMMQFKICTLKKVKISGLKLGESGLASIEVKSIKNALEDLSILSKESNYTLDSISGFVLFENQKINFEATKQACFSYEEDYRQIFIPILIKSIK